MASDSEVRQVSDPREFAREARAEGKLVVWVPLGARSKETLLLLFADALRFPRYFRRNWDAFEECLRDLRWLPEKASVTIVHEQLPFSDGENRRTYFAILHSAAVDRQDGRTIRVAVPEPVATPENSAS